MYLKKLKQWELSDYDPNEIYHGQVTKFRFLFIMKKFCQ